MKTILLLLTLSMVQGQQVQWANKVLKYSSDLGGKQNGIKRITGKPDAFPQGGPSPNAWTPKDALKGYAWVEVNFEKPQSVKQVAVFENLNTGCVVKIGVDTGSGKYQTVWSRKANYKTPTFKGSIPADHNYYFRRKRRKIQQAPEVLNPGIEHALLENSISGVVAVRVEFNFGLLPGQKQIDAIGISDSEQPLEASINTLAVFEKLSPPHEVLLEGIVPTNPTLTLDGKKLFVTDTNSDKDKIYSFTKDNQGNWSNKREEVELNRGELFNYIEYAGNDFLLKGGSSYSLGAGETGYELFATKDGKYNQLGPVKVTAFANYEPTSDATMTANKKIMLLGIETDFTQGGTDLYFAQQKDDGSYGFLQNMGKVINSAADEGMMQLLSDEKTLLFTSNGFSGYGDFDIYISYRLDDTWKNWSEPKNMGSIINSSEFDGLPFYDESHEILYYVTNKEGKNRLMMAPITKEVLLKTK
jgi:hypothetical protein